ncbi:MAG: NAD(P)-dependent alcohol dehydrogenase [Chloroflexota bacterium]
MRAIVQHRYGKPEDVLELRDDVDKPQVGENQVLVRVSATSLNSGDWRRVYASPAFIRLVAGYRRPKDRLLGGDAAGVVEKVGPGATELKVGDEVFGIRSGAFAEYVSGQHFVRKPANLSMEHAATVPIAGVTALQALREKGNVQPGERVLINGAGGGVGTFAVQIAKAFGAEVTAVTSSDKVDLVRSIGADHVVDYSRTNFTKGGYRYDLIVDIGGNHSFRALHRCLAPNGRIVMVGAGKGMFGVFGRLIGGKVRKSVLKQPVVFFIAYGPYQDQLTTLKELIEAGKVTPVIDRSYPLTDIAQAITYSGTEKTRGKVVITID